MCAWPLCNSKLCNITAELMTLSITTLPGAIEVALKEHLSSTDPNWEWIPSQPLVTAWFVHKHYWHFSSLQHLSAPRLYCSCLILSEHSSSHLPFSPQQKAVLAEYRTQRSLGWWTLKLAVQIPIGPKHAMCNGSAGSVEMLFVFIYVYKMWVLSLL